MGIQCIDPIQQFIKRNCRVVGFLMAVSMFSFHFFFFSFVLSALSLSQSQSIVFSVYLSDQINSNQMKSCFCDNSLFAQIAVYIVTLKYFLGLFNFMDEISLLVHHTFALIRNVCVWQKRDRHCGMLFCVFLSSVSNSTVDWFIKSKWLDAA